MRIISLILLTFFVSVSIGQTRRGIYKKRDCFCDNHSNTSGWNVGVAGYVSQFGFQNDYINNTTIGYGFGVFAANKLNEHVAVRLGIYKGKLLPVSVDDDMLRLSLYDRYTFKHLNIPLTFLYKFRSEKRFSPYLAVGGEANILRGVEATNHLINSELNYNLKSEAGFNQFNLFIGAGSYILFGDHFGFVVQGSVDMNPFVNNYSNYNFAFTGKFGLTYHF